MDSCLPDSNQRPLDDFRFWLLQSNALPTELRQVSDPKTLHLLDQGKLLWSPTVLTIINPQNSESLKTQSKKETN